MSVYRVTELIGTSPTSWEDAATEAVRRAQQTIHDIRVAEVLEQDMAMDESGRITFRTKLRISFKIRPAKTADSGS
jgi:flavin-binding protein dodecin